MQLHLIGLIHFGLSILILFFSVASTGQQLDWYAPEGKLKNTTINTFFVNSQGFLWMTDADGFHRYDGYEFTTYIPSSITAADASLSILFEDQEKNIWLKHGTNGMEKFNIKTESFYPFTFQSLPKGISINQVLYEASKDRIWVATGAGLYYFQKEHEQFGLYEGVNQPISKNFISLETDSAGNIWLGTPVGLSVLNPKTGVFVNYNTDPNDESTLSMNHILSLARDFEGNMWVGTMWGINKAIPEKKNYPEKITFKRIIPRPGNNAYNFVYSITPHPSGDLWITSSRCVFRMKDSFVPEFTPFLNITTGLITGNEFHQPVFDSYNNVFFRLNAHPKGIYYFDYSEQKIKQPEINFSTLLDREQEFRISALHIDDSDVLWVGIEKKGFLKYNLRRRAFTVMLPDTDVYGVYKSHEGKIFAGSRSGLNILDPEKNSWQMISPASNASMPNKFPGTIRAFDPDYLYIGFWDGLMSIYDIRGNFFRNFTYDFEDSTSLRTWSVRDILKDSKGNIWLGGSDAGLTLMTDAKGRFRYFDSHPLPERNYQENWVVKIMEGKDGNLWLGGRFGGLYKFNTMDSTFTSIKYTDKFGEVVPYEVREIYPESDSIMWLATRSAGLLQFNIHTQQFKTFSVTDGLPSMQIKSMIADDDYNLWLGTNNGLSRFNPETFEIRNFYTSDGLPSDDFNDGTPFKDENGTLFFGTTRGLVSFHPDDIRFYPYNPGLSLTSLYLFNDRIEIDSVYHNQQILTKSIALTDTLIFNHLHQMISIEFAAFHYSAPDKIKYLYKLENFDNDWRAVPSNSRRATYTNLPPGKYYFVVKTINTDGIESPETLRVYIHVLTPWFQSVWFKFLILILVLLIILSIYRVRLLQLKRQKIKLEKTVEIRTRELSDANQKLLFQQDKISRQNNQLAKQANQLKEADYIKTRFFINISHELRTPLTLILSPIDSLLKKLKKPGQQNLLRLMQKNTQRLLLLIDQLLDIRKIETGNKNIVLAKGDICEFVSGVTGLFKEAAKEKKIRLSFIDTEINNRYVFFDQDVLDKVLHNLISNAIKYTPSGQRVVVELKPPGEQYMVINVSNTGIGIDDKKKQDVFRRFYHHDPQKGNAGYGIGLSYVKDLLNIYKGEISVSSVGNEFTLFSVKIPLLPELIPQVMMADDLLKPLSGGEENPENTFARVEENLEGKEKDHKKPVLLIIEDNTELAGYLAAELSPFFKTRIASDGVQGLEMAQKYIPDAIISDIMMPEMDGKELCEKLKTDILTSHIPVILLTARATPNDQVAGLQTGADDYITKPFNIDILKAKVFSLLHNRKILADNLISPLGLKRYDLNKLDLDFIEKCGKIIRDNIFNPDYDYDAFYHDLNMSKSNCYRKTKALTGKSPGEFILIEKMKIAAQLISSGQFQPTQLAYEMGYNNPSNFSRDFKKVFNKTPREFV
jgi:signal transduction histidine kinase/ligand-binding sensor domain-containing protein/CheY-like chemotaxis protein/AraC-like DNA-binding protein